MKLSNASRELIRSRLADEIGRIDKQAPHRIALAYPSPYAVGMSSLGYQSIYRIIQAMPGVMCERVFLPDGADRAGTTEIEVPVSYESLRPLGDFPIIAFSVAYELEIAGMIRMLDEARVPLLVEDRREGDPIVIAGGPLTFSNPVPMMPFADVVIQGEAEEVTPWAIEVIHQASTRDAALDNLAAHPHINVPIKNGYEPRNPAACDLALLPAISAIRTPHTELSNMFLIEAERGCSRECKYCVMRRTTNGGMRLVSAETILSSIPEDVMKVGLVGAAVSDHPKITHIVNELADRGLGVGLSSLRPDRLKEPFIEALCRGGYRTLTTALDGTSERMRQMVVRRGYEKHYVNAAELARKYKMKRLKLYLMVGLPEEDDSDIDECVEFVSGLSKIVPIALGVAPFCAKRKTPLDGYAYAGVDVVSKRLDRLRKGLKGRADVRSTSAKWAWVEYVLAQGGAREGRAMIEAVQAGGRFADYRKAFAPLGYSVHGAQQAGGSASPRKLPLLSGS